MESGNRIPLIVLRMLFFLGILCNAWVMMAQSQRIDSLQHELQKNLTDSSRVKVLNALAMDLYGYNEDQAHILAVQALELSRKIGFLNGEKFALLLNGVYFYGVGDPKEALSYYRRSQQIKADRLYDGYALNLIGNIYRQSGNLDSAMFYHHQSIELLEQLGNKFFLSIAYKNLGLDLSNRWQLESANNYFQKSLKLRLELKDTVIIADSYYTLARLSINQGDFDKAEEWVDKGCSLMRDSLTDQNIPCHFVRGEVYYRKGENLKALRELQSALRILEKRPYREYHVNTLIRLGQVYDAIGQQDKAFQFMFNALKMAEGVNMNPQIAAINSHIGWLYKNQNEFNTAWTYLQRSESLYRKMNDVNGVSYVYNIKGLIQYQTKKLDSAQFYLKEALAIRKSIQNKSGEVATTYNLALVYEELKEYDRALELQFKNLKLEEELENHTGIGISYNSIGSIFLKKNNLPKAEYYLKLAELEANYTQSKSLRRFNIELFSKLYEQTGDLRKAIYYHKRLREVNDSIYSENSTTKAAELRSLYELEKQQQQIKNLEQQQNFNQQQIAKQRTVIIFSLTGLVSLLIAGLVGYRYYRIKSRLNKELEKLNREIREQKEEIQSQSEELIEANQIIASTNKTLELKIDDRTSELKQAYKELDTFFYRSSHDFRRPLTTFLGLAEVAKITVKDPNSLELFDKVRETAVNLDRMLIKLQSISDLGTQQMVFKEVLIRELAEQSFDVFRNEILERSIDYKIEVDQVSPFYSYPALIKLIFENIIENSVQFSGPQGGHIKLFAKCESTGIQVKISDNGIGIMPEYQERVFDMYFRANEKSRGNGLGLYIVKKAIQKLRGTIYLQSEFQHGTTVEIFVPNMKD